MSFKRQVAAALKEAREREGLTMQELANRLGVFGTANISRYESGKYNLSSDLIERIAKAIGVSPEIVFHKEKSSK